MQHRRAGTDRFDGIGDERQLFILHIDQIHRLFGDLIVVRGHCRDRFADVAHPVVRQQRHVFHSQADHHAGDVGAGDNRAHAGKF